MKHAAIKITKAGKVSSQAQGDSAEKKQKIANPKAPELTKNKKAKIENELTASVSQNKKTKKSSITSTVVAFPKSKIEKPVPVVSDKKTALVETSHKAQTEKLVLVAPEKLKSVSVKSKTIGQNSKSDNIPISNKQEKSVSKLIKKQKSLVKIVPTVDFVAEQNLKKEKTVPVVAVQKVNRTEKVSKILPIKKTETAISKKVTFFSINKIEVIKKKVDLASEKNGSKSEETVKLSVSVPEAISIEDAPAAKAAIRKPKPKKNKPIGAAVFRGKKERYDFQVYELDAEFVDVPAIYVISKRKTDKQKRAHHALVCIGQTDSILGEIKKHKNKCIKKHNANVISILPEENEKKRLKIEEDLKAAHAIACNIA